MTSISEAKGEIYHLDGGGATHTISLQSSRRSFESAYIQVKFVFDRVARIGIEHLHVHLAVGEFVLPVVGNLDGEVAKAAGLVVARIGRTIEQVARRPRVGVVVTRKGAVDDVGNEALLPRSDTVVATCGHRQINEFARHRLGANDPRKLRRALTPAEKRQQWQDGSRALPS